MAAGLFWMRTCQDMRVIVEVVQNEALIQFSKFCSTKYFSFEGWVA